MSLRAFHWGQVMATPARGTAVSSKDDTLLKGIFSYARRVVHKMTRKLISRLPRSQRFKVFRAFIDCAPTPSQKLILKIAETKEELEGCFAILHDAYVDSGFMKPDPSGMRVTIYHALPTTTMLCAKYNGRVVGTISLIRENALGIPLQTIFDLAPIREKEGHMAEVSALAIHRDFRNTRGSILFPLMKFMYEYCTTFFDTRHLLIAVNPSHIEMYESMLFFKRLTTHIVESYDFVNGAPAIGATLDLKEAPEIFRKHYSSKPPRRNLYAYFKETKLPNIQFPQRRFFTTNDPVLTPELIDYFFNVRTEVFRDLSQHQKALLYSIYDLPEYRAVLPALSPDKEELPIRHHQRFSVKCPARMTFLDPDGLQENVSMDVIEVSPHDFVARAHAPLPLNTWCDTTIQLGHADVSHFRALALNKTKTGSSACHYGFRLGKPDLLWMKFVSALDKCPTHSALESAAPFLQ